MEQLSFDEQLRRLHAVLGTQTQSALADVLGVKQSAISKARECGKIPTNWLLALVTLRGVNPEWILFGRGCRKLDMTADCYDTADTVREKEEMKNMLARLPSRLLADELVRRTAVVEYDFSDNNDE